MAAPSPTLDAATSSADPLPPYSTPYSLGRLWSALPTPYSLLPTPASLIRLDANENPFGPSPRVARALAEYPDYGFYPDYLPLRQAVARYAGVAPVQVILSNGADEMIDLLIRLFVEPGQAIVTCPPTFSMYGIFARVNRCQVLSVPRRGDFSLDVAAITATVEASDGNARILFLVSPGNPDGQAIPLNTIRELLALPLIVAVDETYIEFGGETTVPLLPDHDNLIVIRTFSKWAGLAGLRLGYALGPDRPSVGFRCRAIGMAASDGALSFCHSRESGNPPSPGLTGWLERIRAPYNVNAAAMVAAMATLEDLETVQSNVSRLTAERERLRESLAALTWIEPLPSQANFILCRLKDRTGQDVVSGLAKRGILVRGFSDPTMAEYVRIGVGRPEQNETLLTALRELGGEYVGQTTSER